MRPILLLIFPLVLGTSLLVSNIIGQATLSTATGWKFETWEKQIVPFLRDENKPWPLLTPKRNERTVLFRFRYSNRHLQEVPADDDEAKLAEELSVEVEFEPIYDTLVFLAAAWIMGHLAFLLGMPTLVGEIITGFLLGPPLADFVPYPEAMVLIGDIGLVGLLLEAGIEIDIAQLKETGARSFFMSACGSVLPLIVGIGLSMAAGEDIQSAIATGACFSPTSSGVATNVLSAGNVLNTPVGQLIAAACVIDDIMGLVMLSMLEVLVDPEAQLVEYFIPFISAFGYLIVLGYSALTWMPRLIENKILPIFPKAHRDVIAFGIMIALAFAYLPLLNYSRANYLTGAFLAGITFSQIESVHHTWISETHTLMTWLLRLFFAASIGFQVPIKMFNDPYIFKWGFIFYVCILAKLPLGAFVPKFQDQVPKGFPYDPYWRDVWTAALAMTCRGEFSFVMAAFALGEGIFTREIYSAVVFGVLLSAITSPIILLFTIKYYNRLSESFMVDAKPVTQIADGDSGGQMPLYIAIQARTANQWGLQENFRKALQNTGLIVIDHRSWHPRGRNAVVMTEMYTEDPTVMIRFPNVGMNNNDRQPNHQTDGEDVVIEPTLLRKLSVVNEEGEEGESERMDVLESQASILHPSHSHLSQPDQTDKNARSKSRVTFHVETEKTLIEQRCQEIQKVLMSCVVKKESAKIQISQWHPIAFNDLSASEGTASPQYSFRNLSEGDRSKLLSEVNANFDAHKPPSTSEPTLRGPTTGSPTILRNRRTNLERIMSNPRLSTTSLWEVDDVAHQAAQKGVIGSVQYDVSSGHAYGQSRRRTMPHELTLDAPLAEERLFGFVRAHLPDLNAHRTSV